MDRLDVLSAAFLDAEDVSPELSMVIGSCAVLRGPQPSIDDLRRLVAERLHLVPRYRQRVRSAPLDLVGPVWVDDPRFEVGRHVVEEALPTPGGDVELAGFIGDLMARRMDRHHPLLDVTAVGGLDGGRWALVCRVHHALADGVSGTGLLPVVYDAEQPPVPGPRIGMARPGSATGRLHDAVRAVRGGVALSSALVPVGGPSVTGPVRSGRRYTWVRVPTGSTRAVRQVQGVTVNDVVLASVAGGFRRLLEHRGLEHGPHTLRSLVPVSSRTDARVAGPGNRITLLLADLPVHVAEPLPRLLAVHDLVARLRDEGEPEAGVWLQRLLGAAPRALTGRAARLLLRLPQHQVATVTTNVPGPPAPLSCLGRRVESFLPYVPIADRVRIGVAVLTYCDELVFGLSGDREVTDLDVLADGIAESWWALADEQVLRPEAL